MSRALLDWSYAQTDLTMAENSVLNFICDSHNGSSGKCCPFLRTIADSLCSDPATISRILKRLQDKGKIVIHRKGKASCYTFPHLTQDQLTLSQMTPSHLTLSQTRIDSQSNDKRTVLNSSFKKEPKHVELKLDHPVDNSKTKNGSQVLEVFEFWKSESGHLRAKLDDKRKRLIRARLKDGYSVAELGKAILGNLSDDFYRGMNDRSTKYDDIVLICRDAAHVDKFLAMADKKGLEVEV